MDNDCCDDILKSEGFSLIGVIHHRLVMKVWWHAEHKIEVVVMPFGDHAILKGAKGYFLQSIAEEGETWARDISALHDYLEAHFPEMHLAFSYFRDISPTLAEAQARRKNAVSSPTIRVPTLEQLAEHQRNVERLRQDRRAAGAISHWQSGESPFLQAYLRDQSERLGRELDQAEAGLQQQSTRAKAHQGLQREYLAKGSAARLVFSINSNAHTIASATECLTAVHGVVKELLDTHRYQVTQKLGGRLRIQADEADAPDLLWMEHWLAGGVAPKQMQQLGQAAEVLADALESQTMVMPDRDLVVDGSVKDSQKLLAARAVGTLLSRLDRPDPAGLNARDLAKGAMPATVGRLMRGDCVTEKAAILPLATVQHAYVSGTTGSGKSCAARVLIEEAAAHKDLSILILDPRNQAVGLRVPEDREDILSLYPQHGLKQTAAKGFAAFRYHAPGMPYGDDFPSSLGRLANRRSIVSFKGLCEREACDLFAEILDAVFGALAESESERVRLLIVVEEAQRFTRKHVPTEAKEAGRRAERALDRTAREGRKYGQCLVIVSQAIKDFAYESAAIRQNTNTKVFLRNSDREADYARDFIGSGREIFHLPTATALVHNAAWGTMKIRLRPPLSKVWEFSPEDTRDLLVKNNPGALELSETAGRLLEHVQRYHSRTGEGMNMSEAAQAMGITSKRRMQALLNELENAGRVMTKKLRQRGQPRVILPSGPAISVGSDAGESGAALPAVLAATKEGGRTQDD